ncbi:MAG: mannose-6-phosphate isomerase [Sodalis sp. Ffu]|nr:MAG: mannose-6-phosphate isomerase [Sodalis sp. Ffu]
MFSLLQPIAGAHPSIAAFLAHIDTQHLAQLFSNFLSMEGKQKSLTLDILKTSLAHQHNKPWDYHAHDLGILTLTIVAYFLP